MPRIAYHMFLFFILLLLQWWNVSKDDRTLPAQIKRSLSEYIAGLLFIPQQTAGS